MASLNLLFIHEIEYQTKVVYEVHEFPEQFAARGHGVTFIEFPETLRVPNFAKSKRDRNIDGRVLSATRLRLLSPLLLGAPRIDRLLATATYVPLLLGLLSRKKFDAIVLYAVPTYGWQTVLIARFFKVPVLYRALDVSHKIRESAFEPLIKMAERFIYRRATRVSANNPAMARYCESFGKRILPTEVNLPPLDVGHFDFKISNSQLNSPLVSRAALGIGKGETVIMYMGSFFYFSGLVEVITNFSELKLQDRGFKLVLVGGGEQDRELRDLTQKLNLDSSVIFTGFVDYNVLGEYLQLADIFINPMKPNLVSNTAFPHKVLQYMASGRPVVSTKLDGLFETFGSTSGITWVSQPVDILPAALDLVANTQAMGLCVVNQNATVEQLLNMDTCISSFHEAIERTIGTSE